MIHHLLTQGLALGKRLIVGTCLAVGVIITCTASLGSFSSSVHAQSTAQQGRSLLTPGSDNVKGAATSTVAESNLTLVKNLELVTKTLYLILWPALAIAGASLDNTLVYGDAFNMSGALLIIRQIMRTIANFVIGLIFVGGIGYSFFKFGTATEQLNKIIKGVLVSAVLVNMSRFILASLIDISTIATVGIGALPMTVTTQSSGFGDDALYYIHPHTLLNLENNAEQGGKDSNMNTLYSCTPRISPSPTAPDFTVGAPAPAPIVAPPTDKEYYMPCIIDGSKLVGPSTGNTKNDFDNNKANAVEVWKGTPGNSAPVKEPWNISDVTISDEYCVYDRKVIKLDTSEEITNCEFQARLLQEGTDHMTNTRQCQTPSDIFSRGQNSTGPLFTLYGSIFDMATLVNTGNGGNIGMQISEMMLKSLVGIALLLPLVVLAIVLIYRVVLLWLVIVFSPLLTLVYVFGFEDKIGDLKDKFGLKSVVSMIFLPVTVVFALSISLLFLTLIQNITYKEATGNISDSSPTSQLPNACPLTPMTLFSTKASVGDEGKIAGKGTDEDKKSRDCFLFGNQSTYCIELATRGFGVMRDIMSWLVINLLGIAVMRVVVFQALKSAKFAESLVEGVQDLAQKGLQTVPIIPVPGMGGNMSLGAVKQAQNKLGNEFDNLSRRQFNNSKFNEKFEDVVGDLNGKGDDVREKLASDPMSVYNTVGSSGLGMSAYDGQVEGIRNKMNETLPEGKRIGSNVNTFRELLEDENFVTASLSDDNTAQGFVAIPGNLEKSGRPGEAKAVSASFIKGLTKPGSQRFNAEGTASIPDSKKKNTVDHLWADNQLIKLPWGVKEGVLSLGDIKNYSLQAPGTAYENSSQVNSFMSLLKDNGTLENLDDGLKTAYFTPLETAIKTALTADNTLVAGYDGAVTIQFPGNGTDSKLLNVKVGGTGTDLSITQVEAG